MPSRRGSAERGLQEGKPTVHAEEAQYLSNQKEKKKEGRVAASAGRRKGGRVHGPDMGKVVALRERRREELQRAREGGWLAKPAIPYAD